MTKAEKPVFARLFYITFIFRGTYNSNFKAENLTMCLSCTAGSYCPGTANVDPLPCEKGNYSDSGASSCITCEAGYYCDLNTTSLAYMLSDRICPAGVECPPGMSRAPDLVQDKCRLGYYCPRGDVNPYPVPCPNGTFNGQYGLTQVSECQQCTAGMYCVPEGLTAPAGDCPGGYYCPLGTGPPESYPCPIGFYRNGSAKESFQDCAECISGYYCDREGLALPIDCPAGYFCVSGSTFAQPCPLGTYSNSTNLRRATDCTPCPGGYYCDGIGRTSPTDVCDAGFYCREKAYTSAPPDGLTGGLCPAGGYCPPGSATASSCVVGKYSASPGAKTEFDCIPCDPGFFCAGSSSTDASQKCSAGYYCTGGAGIPTQHETPAGYYTQAGAFKPEPCPRGQYQPSVRSETCLVCPQGYYCNGTATIDEVICPKGTYCPLGSENPTPCPPGTYLNDIGLYDLIHCTPCKGGYACEVYGIDIPTVSCEAGHYCTEGSNTTTPIGQSFGDLCPPGYFCPEQTDQYQHHPCPNGTYSSFTGLQSESNCTSCDPGRVCNGLALTEPNDWCSPGYYCGGGASSNKPNDGGLTGDPCLTGSYCPNGTGE